jgi:integrase/recombinase XerC
MDVERFLDYLKHERRYSAHTVAAYANDLSQLKGYLDDFYELTNLLECSTIQLRSWIVDMSEHKVSPRTINRRLVAVRSFFKWSIQNGLVTASPAEGLTMLKTRSRLPEFVDENDMERLLDHLPLGEGLSEIRNRTIIELLYQTGIRVSELTRLTRGGFSDGMDHLKVTGKRDKERIVPFGRKLRSQLLAYLALRDQKYGIENGAPLFFTDRGKPLYPRFVYLLVKRYLSMVTTLTRKSPHVIRHTFATAMLNGGADINAVKELLGHSSLASTQVYTHNTVEKLKRVYRLAHPRA